MVSTRVTGRGSGTVAAVRASETTVRQRHRQRELVLLGLVLDRRRHRRCGWLRAEWPQPREQLVEGRPGQRVGIERGVEDGGERSLDAGQVVLAAAGPVHDRHRRSAPVRRTPGRAVRHRCGPGVDVRRSRRVVAVQDLGREITGRAEQPAGLGEPRVVGDAGEAEVDEDRRTALHQHVRRLDVAVEHVGLVDRGDALGEAAGEPVQVAVLDRSFLDARGRAARDPARSE